MGITIKSLSIVFSPLSMVFMSFGTLFGVVCGALPGLGPSMAVILLLPFTYAMDPIVGIITLVAVNVGAQAGGSISSILLRVPGTPSAIATTFDGYPMAMQGKAGRALGLAFTASVIGSIFSAIAMLVATPLLSNVALKFQSAEFFSLALLGLSCISSLGAKNQAKSLFAACLGLLLSTVGLDSINGVERFTFGQEFLLNGIDFIPVMIGAYAIAEVYETIGRSSSGNSNESSVLKGAKFEFIKLKDVLTKWKTYLKGSIIGTIVGIIPAAGGSIAAFIAYSEEVRSSKTPEKFGTGVEEGIIAPESSNNACVGGSMVPTLTLGIPGSPVAAIIMAAFMLHGLTPGPLLIQQQPAMLQSIFFGMIASSLLLFVFGKIVAREFTKILKLPYPLLAMLIMVLGVVGAYSLRNNLADVFIAFAFSFVGYFFNKYGYSTSSFILGLVLGRIAENSMRKQLIISGGSWLGFVTRPISLVILLLSLAAFLSPYYRKFMSARKSGGVC
ncbi:MAG: tripartite tricarboxylate transporter permease [Spirochaetes bacterium]|nr:tripartite tricarboxylate transporter permease [Spirochaetota bacterium]